MNVYQEILGARADLTDWVIHWTRVRGERSAWKALLTIIRKGILIPTFAKRPYRSSRRATIYGPRPAVCFTEQPLIEFARYVRARRDPTKVTGYAIAVHKHDLFAAGGRPVIYGFDCPCEAEIDDDEYSPDRRMLKPSCSVAVNEQYRYSAFDPTRTPWPLDWTHEREWRWAPGKWGTPALAKWCFRIAGSGTLVRTGLSKGRFVFIVPRDTSAVRLRKELRRIIRTTSPKTTYAKRYLRRLKRVHIISLEKVQREVGNDAHFSRIETYPLDDAESR